MRITFLGMAALLCAAVACLGAESEQQGLRIDVPFRSQVKDGCGSAAVAMVIEYWARQRPAGSIPPADVGAIHRKIYLPSKHGSMANDVEGYFRSSGFRTFSLRGQWSDLEEHVKLGRPLIVAIRPAGAAGNLHYVVVTGLSSKSVLLHDPAQKPHLILDRADFLNRWAASQNWLLLALPAQ